MRRIKNTFVSVVFAFVVASMIFIALIQWGKGGQSVVHRDGSPQLR